MQRRTFVLAACSAAGLAACAPEFRTNPLSRAQASNLGFSSIIVSTSGASFENALAAEYSTELGPQLRAALANEFSNRIAAGGSARMEVEIARLNVAGSTRTAFGSDQSRMQGTVRIVENDSGAVLASYIIDVIAGAASESRTGALISSAINSSDRYYRRLLTQFADQTRAQIEA